MFSAQFWKDLAERAVKTFAQALVAVLAVSIGSPVWHIDWLAALGIALTATLLSVLTSLASTATGDPDSASAVDYVGRHRAEG